MTTIPPLPWSIRPFGDAVVATLTCALCGVATAPIHSATTADGTPHVDLERLGTGLGYRVTLDGRVACSASCANRANAHRRDGDPGDLETDVSIDASANPHDPRLRWRTEGLQSSRVSTGPTTSSPRQERTVAITCARGCGARQPVDQHKVGDGDWTPSAVDLLAAVGWQQTPAGLFCGKTCAHIAGIDARLAGAPVVPVTTPIIPRSPPNRLAALPDPKATKGR